jgi:hypothetical protein
MLDLVNMRKKRKKEYPEEEVIIRFDNHVNI